MAAQDWLAILFHTLMFLSVMAAPDSANASTARRVAFLLLTVTTSTIVVVRSELLKTGKLRSLLYRFGLFTPLAASYFELRWLLPGLAPALVDSQLHALDVALLGTTPSVWMAQFNTLYVVEWISFFYYSYFALMAIMLLPALFRGRGQPQQQLLFGALIVCIVGHFTYTLVPGVGPYATLDFAEPLEGGFWWAQVTKTVASAGAMYDIFPSLHTAYPCFYALYAFSQRKRKPWKYTWPILAFFAANMLIATMFLRWHWLVDVVAGLCLAVSAHQLSVFVSHRESSRGLDDDDRQSVWEKL